MTRRAVARAAGEARRTPRRAGALGVADAVTAGVGCAAQYTTPRRARAARAAAGAV